MKKILMFLFLLFVNFEIFGQDLLEKEYVVVIIDIQRKDDLHPRNIFYWVVESEKLEKSNDFDFSPIS